MFYVLFITNLMLIAVNRVNGWCQRFTIPARYARCPSSHSHFERRPSRLSYTLRCTIHEEGDDQEKEDEVEVQRRIIARRIAKENDRSSLPIVEKKSLTAVDYIVPGFVAVWAIGYSAIAYVETSIEGGLGELGGLLGVAFACGLLLFLVAASFYEVFKPDS